MLNQELVFSSPHASPHSPSPFHHMAQIRCRLTHPWELRSHLDLARFSFSMLPKTAFPSGEDGRGGGRVGQFGSSGCRIKSTSIFVIFSNEGLCSSMSVMTGHQNDNNFVLTQLHDGPRSDRRGPFMPQKSAFFYATPI